MYILYLYTLKKSFNPQTTHGVWPQKHYIKSKELNFIFYVFTLFNPF